MSFYFQHALIVLVMVSQAAADAAGTKRLTVRGTHVSLLPAPDFEESAGFTGLESEKHQASLMFMELPTPGGGDAIQEIGKTLTPERLRSRGFMLKSSESGKQNGQSTLLIKGEVRKGGQTYVQWLFLMGSSEARAVQVLVTAPADEFRRIEDACKLMLAGLRWEKQLAAKTGSRYYDLVLPAGWKLAKQVGPLELYTESGRFPKAPSESGLAVTNLHQKPTNFQAFVKANNLKRNHYVDLKELESTFLKIDGFDANISHVSAIRVDDQKPVILQYCYIFIGRTMILIDGDRTDKLSKEAFEKVCKSWKLKEQENERKP